MIEFQSGVSTIYEMVKTYKSDLSNFNTQVFDSKLNAFTENTFTGNAILSILNPEQYTTYVGKCMDNLETVHMNMDKLVQFYDAVYKSTTIDDKNITIELRNLTEVDKIRPQYITIFANDCKSNITKILAGGYNIKTIREKMLKDSYFDKIKMRMVKTTLPLNITNDYAKMDSPVMVKVNSTYIMNSILPSLKNSDSILKEQQNISSQISSNIFQTTNSITEIVKAIEDMTDNNKIDKHTRKLVNYYLINLARKYMDVCCFLCYMFNRKTIALTYNYISYSNLYNTINNYFPEGELVLHENALDGNIEDIEDSDLTKSMLYNNMSIVIPFITRTIDRKKLEISSFMNRVIDDAIDVISYDYEYDKTPYINMNNIFMNIMNSLNVLNANSKDPNMTADEIQSKSGFEVSLVEKFDNIIQTVDMIGLYNSEGIDENDKTITVYHELSEFEDNISDISETVKVVYMRIKELIDKFEMNNNLEFTEDETRKELLSLLYSIKSQFKELSLVVAKKIISRLNNLNDVFTNSDVSYDDNNSEPIMLNTNYMEQAVLYELEEMDKKDAEIFEAKLIEYHKLRNKLNHGIDLVLEADDNDSSTKAGVQVAPDANKQENDSNVSTGTQTTNTVDKKKGIQGIFDTISKLINDFINKCKKLGQGKDKGTISNVKTIEIDPEKTTISVMPYENVTVDSIISDISSVTNKINSINSESDENLKSDTVFKNYLFSNIPKEGDFRKNMIAYFSYKDVKVNSVKTYTGAAAKQVLDVMLEYCGNYENNMSRVETSIKSLTKAASDKALKISDTSNIKINSKTQNKDNKNKSVSATVDGQNVTNKNSSSKGEMIMNQTRLYTTAILTALEKKYFDYMVVIRGIEKNYNSKQTTDNSNEENENK